MQKHYSNDADVRVKSGESLCPNSRTAAARNAGPVMLGLIATIRRLFMRLLKPGLAFALMLIVSGFAVVLSSADTSSVTITGYVIDSACTFTKDLGKPISKQCATACAKAGSQLVILADDGTIYWPIAATTPSSGQNPKLLPFAADKVTVTGKVYQRGGSKAIVIDKIEPQSSGK
jgi:hypothetical protein